MRKAWFAYTAGSKGPIPNIFYDDKPTNNFLNPTILQIHELEYKWFINDSSILSDEVTSSFNILQQYFPYTGDEYSKGETFKLPEAAE